MSDLLTRIKDEMKTAMKSGDKARLGVIRLMLAAVKQIEVDERIELDDNRVLLVLDKMVKQRRESIRQYTDANRTDLADIEAAEIIVIQ
ncbi:MAG: GatB/YqeY domain-containing protein, partial [Methylococcales bacterium]|nr:GatB/YqeY domain-containing protein [Methylococcales bacterium]